MGRGRSLIKRKIRGVSCVSLLRAQGRGGGTRFPPSFRLMRIPLSTLFPFFRESKSRKLENTTESRDTWRGNSSRWFIREKNSVLAVLYPPRSFLFFLFSRIERGTSISRRVLFFNVSASSTAFSPRFSTVSGLVKKSCVGAMVLRCAKMSSNEMKVL